MPQLSLFEPAARVAARGGSGRIETTPRPGDRADRPAIRPESGDPRNHTAPLALERPDSVQIDRESDRILDALRCESHDGFLMAVEPLLTAEERTMLRLARGLPRQLALAYDQIIDRLTLRWADLSQWPTFGRIVEPGTLIRPNLRVCVIALDAPSRSLDGRVAFSVERNLAHVSGPIPTPVLRCIQENWGSTFAALAYLEPLYSTRHERGARRLLRSLQEVREHYAEPIDPLVVGWLGGGPRNYGLPGLVERPPWPASEVSAVRRSSRGEVMFLLGHWD